MKKLLYIIVGCCFLFPLLSSPIHFFNLPQDDDEFSFFSDTKKTEEKGVVEDKESETANNEPHDDQVVSCEPESWFFSRFSMLSSLDDDENDW